LKEVQELKRATKLRVSVLEDEVRQLREKRKLLKGVLG